MTVMGCRSVMRVFKLSVFGGAGGCISILALPLGRIVEGPMLDLALAALHQHAADLVVAAANTTRAQSGKWMFVLGIRSSGRMRLKQSSMSALANESG